MKWCVEFPEETILVVRPSLDDICYGIKPAAKLLSELLYRCSIRAEHQQDAHNMNDLAASQGKEPTQDTTLRIYRTQAQLVDNMIHEITEKTLHNVAVPTLQLLGYLDLEEYPGMNCYIVHIDVVRESLIARKQGAKELFLFLLTHLQLEKFLIDIELEKVLIDKKNFQLALEKVLIANRNSSNCKRGRKPKPEEPREPQSEEPQINRDYSKIGNREESIVVSAVAENDAPAANGDPRFNAFIHNFEEERKRITDGRLKAVSPSHSQADRGNDDLSDMPTEKLRITKPEQTIPAGGDAAQAIDPPQASSGGGTSTIRSNGAVQASIPKRPRTSKKVTQAKPVITLSVQEQAFWDLWCGVWFNLDIPPDLTETAYGHVKKLAPFITTSEQLNSLIDYTRKDLAASQNIKRKMVQLGNMVFCYAGWKQAQQQPANNISKNGTDLNQYGLQALLQRQEQKAV